MTHIPESYFHQETERLQFRALNLDDILPWIEFLDNNPYLHFVGVDPSKNETPLQLSTEWINRQLDRYKVDGFGMLAVIEKSSGQFIGMTGIISRDVEGKPEKEIGYSYMSKTWGKGYATEAAIQMHTFGKENQLSKRFISMIHLDNKASMRVAEKNGMKPLFETFFQNMNCIVYGTEPS